MLFFFIIVSSFCIHEASTASAKSEKEKMGLEGSKKINRSYIQMSDEERDCLCRDSYRKFLDEMRHKAELKAQGIVVNSSKVPYPADFYDALALRLFYKFHDADGYPKADYFNRLTKHFLNGENDPEIARYLSLY